MSYCRMSEKSDVYMWGNTQGGYSQIIKIKGQNYDFRHFNLESAKEMLVLAKRLGAQVPASAIKRINEELK